jgi:hypothetical protein
MDLIKELRELEAKEVFIHLQHEHYKNGSNCNWAIEILDENRDRKYHTGWYGDNHEFGDTIDCYVAAIRFAKWLLEGENAEWFFADNKETYTVEGYNRWVKVREYKKLGDEIVFGKKEEI